MRYLLTLLLVTSCFKPNGNGAVVTTTATPVASSTTPAPNTATSEPAPTSGVATGLLPTPDMGAAASTTTALAATGPEVIPTTGDGDDTTAMVADTGETAPPDLPGDEMDARLVFLSSVTLKGFELAGLAGADALCNDLAGVVPGLVGHQFTALLSDSKSVAADRIGQSSAAFLRLDGVEVAANTDDLLDGILAAPISVTETGAVVEMTMSCARGTEGVWTGSDAAGLSALDTCGDWSSPAANGLMGSYTSTTDAWTACFVRGCSAALRLYCVENE